MTYAELFMVLKASCCRMDLQTRPRAAFPKFGFLSPDLASRYLFRVCLQILLWCTTAHAQDPANCDQQADALLARMTLEEKIGQMTQVDSLAIKDMADIQRYFIGSVLSGGSSDPSPDNSAGSWLKLSNEVQSWALKTRLKIPLIYRIVA